MKITEDYLMASGFHRFCGGFSKSHMNPSWNVSIRPTEGDASWQLSCFVCSTKKFGIYEDNPAPDTNSQSVLGCVTDIEQIEQAMKFCGIHTAWREKIPFSIGRSGGKFKLYQYFEGKNVYAGYETNVYDEAMAEMKRRNIEFTTKNEEQ